MRKQVVTAIGCGLVGLVGTSVLHAQNVELPNPPATDTAPTAEMAAAQAHSVQAPTRGSSMAQVERLFGAPSERAAAVGQPPITRWVYPAFTVYFEYDHVVHAVTTAR